jgi:IS30 family transposase
LCHETIYSLIYAKENKKDKLWKYLTIRRKKRMKKKGRHVHKDSRILEAVSIDKRPKDVEQRKQIGHWESDNVIGKQTDKTALSTTVERVLKITLVSKLERKTADAKLKALFARMAMLPEILRNTMTVDNGSENAHHKQITQSLGMDVYFCHAYHSWEKGTNENTNGRLRRYIPKGISIDTISEKEIAAIEWKLNTTPRKCLNFKTPYEALQEYLTRSV